ncbi:MAG: lipoyl(octanoyl) transferase LipB [Alphaproteobacteria bacterium]|nr:MAG: lipoyl(octanoyl) transferase LipB [Alphaproteobacteria bacterium]
MDVEWITSRAPVAYEDAVAWMEARVAAIAAGTAPQAIWFLEHPPLYTAGTGAKPGDLLAPDRFPVYRSGRGGQYTYHGPGQRVGYVMLDLRRRNNDLRAFVHDLETILIDSLASLGVTAARRAGRVGVWVVHGDGREEKIAAIGVRVRRWITFHGFSLNVCPDLAHFAGIVPCGLPDFGVTSLAALGHPATMAQVDAALRAALVRVFGFDAPAGAAP